MFRHTVLKNKETIPVGLLRNLVRMLYCQDIVIPMNEYLEMV
jgi:hypothetical protein